MSARADAVVLGADVEGLVAAAYLALAGREVVLVDPGARPGGLHGRDEFHPGFVAPGVLHDDQCIRRRLLFPLALDRHGLGWRPAVPLFVPGPEDGRFPRGLLLTRAAESMRAALGEEDGLDQEAYGRWRVRLAHWEPFLSAALDAAPPILVEPGKRALLAYAQKVWALRKLPGKELHELLRAVAMPARDLLDEHFHHPLLRAGLTAPALTPTVLGPRAAGTGLLVVLRECARGEVPAGGLPALVDALVAACRALGVELRSGVGAERIRLGPRGVTGVELSTGETIETLLVLSALDVRRTLLSAIAPDALPAALQRPASIWRARGAVAAVRLALESAPRFRGREEEHIERALTAASLDTLESTADALKYAQLAQSPWLDVRVPTHADPSLAPPGRHVATLLVHGVPYAAGGDDLEAARGDVLERAFDELERVAPGTRTRVLGHEVLLPRDLEARFGLTGGHLFGGEFALDQLWVRRPALALSRYESGIPGLLLAGSSSHPGGPFLGGAGALAARTALGS